MEREEFDLIAVGRALLSDALWASKVKAGDTEGLKPFEAAAMAKLD
jgi:2,4-dienoyl-CoA reductase-like NADH-dependent reductase (Old Yellow Enzyme family)